MAYLFLRPGVSAAVGDFDNTALRKEVPYEIVDAGRQRFSLTEDSSMTIKEHNKQVQTAMMIGRSLSYDERLELRSAIKPLAKSIRAIDANSMRHAWSKVSVPLTVGECRVILRLNDDQQEAVTDRFDMDQNGYGWGRELGGEG